MPLSLAQRNDIARALAEIAGSAGDILTCFSSDACRRTIKPDGTPVSEADEAAEEELHKLISREFPDWPIVSEENAASHDLKGGDAFFLVDPLDGTRAFLAGTKDFCVLIALIVDGIPVAGAIHAPASGRSWWAGADAMTADNRAFDQTRHLVPAPARPRDRIAIISSQHAEGASSELCRSFGIAEIRKESSALKFARLAEGEADIYPRLGRTMQWDVAAGDALLRALGGGVFDRFGQTLRYGAARDGWANPNFVALRCASDLPAIPKASRP